MWSKKSWGGDVDPFIQVLFKSRPDAKTEEIVSLLIFEWEDGEFLGRFPSKEAVEVCTDRRRRGVPDRGLTVRTEKVHL